MAFPALRGLSGCDRVPAPKTFAFRTASSHPLKLQTSAAARAYPFQKPLTSAVPPSTSRSVAPKSFLTVSRPPPAPLDSFKSSAVRSASSLPPLQNLRSASSLSPSTAPTKKNFRPRVAGLPQSLFLRFRDGRLPPLESFKSSAAPRTSTVPPSTSRSVAPKSSFKSSAARLEPAPAPKPPQRLQPVPLNSSNKNLHPRAAGLPQIFSYGFETAACPPRKLQILRSASSLPPSSLSPSTAPTKKTSIHEPLGGRKVFSYGFETAACPPRKLQILRSASSLPPSAARALLKSLKPPRRALPSVPSSV